VDDVEHERKHQERHQQSEHPSTEVVRALHSVDAHRDSSKGHEVIPVEGGEACKHKVNHEDDLGDHVPWDVFVVVVLLCDFFRELIKFLLVILLGLVEWSIATLLRFLVLSIILSHYALLLVNALVQEAKGVGDLSEVHLDLLETLDLVLNLLFLLVHAILEARKRLVPNLNLAYKLAVLLSVGNAHLVSPVALVAEVHQFVEWEHLGVQGSIRVCVDHR